MLPSEIKKEEENEEMGGLFSKKTQNQKHKQILSSDSEDEEIVLGKQSTEKPK